MLSLTTQALGSGIKSSVSESGMMMSPSSSTASPADGEARSVRRRKVAPATASDPTAPKSRDNEVRSYDEALTPEKRDYVAGAGGVMKLG